MRKFRRFRAKFAHVLILTFAAFRCKGQPPVHAPAVLRRQPVNRLHFAKTVKSGPGRGPVSAVRGSGDAWIPLEADQVAAQATKGPAPGMSIQWAPGWDHVLWPKFNSGLTAVKLGLKLRMRNLR